jgi:hypothetical protein
MHQYINKETSNGAIMKIEIGESLIYSFLRHEKSCLVTQTNWKASGNWNISEDTQDSVKYTFDKLKSHHAFSDIFGTQELAQVIKQAEIDVLGISLKNSEQRVYAFEVAFHENGLNYGSKIETRNRIFKKLLRGYLTMKYYFQNHKYTIAFCSPKVHNATEKHIQEYFDVLKEFQSDEVSFEYYSNEKFYTDIMQKTLEKTKNEADSSELFSRAVKLLKLSESFSPIQPQIEENEEETIDPEVNQTPQNIQTQEQNVEIVTIRGNDIPVPPPQIGGVFQQGVRKVMKILLNQNILTDVEIIRLQDAQYCNRELNLNYPLLRLEHKGPIINGYPRYWTRETFGGYLVCNDWYPLNPIHNHYEYFKQWLYNLADNDKMVA